MPAIAALVALLLLAFAFTLLRKNKNDYETPVDPDLPPMEVIRDEDKGGDDTPYDPDARDGGLRGF